jgi:hypothetical protein
MLVIDSQVRLAAEVPAWRPPHQCHANPMNDSFPSCPSHWYCHHTIQQELLPAFADAWAAFRRLEPGHRSAGEGCHPSSILGLDSGIGPVCHSSSEGEQSLGPANAPVASFLLFFLFPPAATSSGFRTHCVILDLLTSRCMYLLQLLKASRWYI